MQRARTQREMKQQRQQQRQEEAKEEPDRGGGFEPLPRAVQPSNAALEEETERLRQEQQLRAQAAAKPKRAPAKAKGGKEEAELQSKQEKELDLKKKMLKKSQKLGVRAAVEWARSKGLDPHIIPHCKDVKACARYCDEVERTLRSFYS